MRMYGKRFLRNQRLTAIKNKRETRDGIIWEIDISNRQVSVKIQGSNKLIKAWFPENWYNPPTWCKLGNSIKIMHTGGERSRVEVVGNGLIVPYPIAGELWPTHPVQENMILTGLNVIAVPNEKSLYVLVLPGTARIEGVEIIVEAMSMEDGDDYPMAAGGFFGGVAAVLECSPGVSVGSYPDWGWRIHSIQLDQEGNITLTVGDQFQAYNNGLVIIGMSEYQGLEYIPRPEVPWGSLELATVTRWENQTVIEDFAIDFEMWKTGEGMTRYGRIETRMDTVIDLPVMAWTDSEAQITVTIIDNTENWAFFSYITLSVEITHGNGLVKDYVYDTAYIGTTCECHQLTGNGGQIKYPVYIVGYKRGQVPTDESPVIRLRLNVNHEISSLVAITLLDAGGNPM